MGSYKIPLALFCFGMSGMLIGGRLYGSRYARHLLEDGVAIDGHVTKRERSYSGRGPARYRLEYSYQYDGKGYSSSNDVPPNYYDAHPLGAAVPVRCDPSNPAKAMLEVTITEWRKWQWTTLAIIGGVVMIGLGMYSLLFPFL